jgi:di/tricarboxylate transporter
MRLAASGCNPPARGRQSLWHQHGRATWARFQYEQARDSIDWTVYITIAFAFAFSTALENSNVAQGIADVFIDISARSKPSGT